MTAGPTPPEHDLARADACLRAGRAAEAEALYRRLLADHPGNFQLHVRLGHALERQGRVQEAIAAYDQAITVNPGHALAFTRRTVLAFRRAFGPPPAPRPPTPGARRLAMSTLGANGRFGNQLLQYGFLRMYAHQHGLALETPDWIGRDLFDLDDPLPPGPLPVVSEESADLVASLNRDIPAVYADVDLWGYCCYPTGRLARHRELFRRLFRPGRKVQSAARTALARLRTRGATLVALHLRRGDFGYGRFWIAPSSWYAAWLDTLWPRFERPVLYVASDDPAAAADFRRFRPLARGDLGVAVPGAEFYLDFYLLAEADAVAISNSTFSFAAAMLNARARAFVRPDRGQGGLVPFDPWDAPVLI